MIDANIVNGHTAVRFASTQTTLYIADATSLQWGTGDFAVEVVEMPGSSLEASTIISKLNSATMAGFEFEVGPNAGTEAYFSGMGLQISNPGSGNGSRFHVAGFRRRNGALEVRVDGTSVPGSFPGDLSEAQNGVTLGYNQVRGIGLIGDIAEVVAVKGTLSDADLTSLESYLRAKYNL